MNGAMHEETIEKRSADMSDYPDLMADISGPDFEDALYQDEYWLNYTELYQNDSTHTFHRHVTPLEHARMTILTMFTGIFIALALWSVMDIKRRIKINTNFYVRLLVLYGVLILCILNEFFLFCDFYYYRNIDFVHHGQWLAFLAEYGRLLQRCIVMAMALNKVLEFYGYTSLLTNWIAFILVSFLYPTAVIVSHAASRSNSSLQFFEYTLIPFIVGLVLFTTLFLKARRKVSDLNLDDINGIKIVLVYIVIFVTECVELWMNQILVRGHIEYNAIFGIINDINLLLFPIFYLIVYRRDRESKWVFSCLNNQSISRLGEGTQRTGVETDNYLTTTELNALIMQESE